MKKAEGMRQLNAIYSGLMTSYRSLDDLYSKVSRPVAPDIQAKTDEIIRASISITCMALNFKEIPQEAKKPIAALLYAAADAMSGDDE